MDGQTDGWMIDKQMNGWMKGERDGWTDRWMMDGQVGGWMMDRWVD